MGKNKISFLFSRRAKRRNDRMVNLTLVSGNVVEQPILEITSRKTNDKKMIRSSQMHLQG